MADVRDGDLLASYTSRREQLTHIRDCLEQMTTEALDVPHIDRVSFRVKDPKSFVAKALSTHGGEPRYNSPFREIEDQIAGRVLVFFRSDLEPVRAKLIELFGAVEEVRKEPLSPSEFDYESDHLVGVIPTHALPQEWRAGPHDIPQTFELQIRTLFQHAWAEPQHDVGYKGVSELDRQTRRELAWVAASAWGADHTLDEAYQRHSRASAVSS